MPEQTLGSRPDERNRKAESVPLRSAGLADFSPADRLPPVIPEDHVWLNPLIHQRWLFMAGKIERQPELLEIPLKNIARWIAMDRLGDVRPLILWRERIERARSSESAFADLLAFLRDDGEEARFMKSSSPFPGVLSEEEMDRFLCAWTH